MSSHVSWAGRLVSPSYSPVSTSPVLDLQSRATMPGVGTLAWGLGGVCFSVWVLLVIVLIFNFFHLFIHLELGSGMPQHVCKIREQLERISSLPYHVGSGGQTQSSWQQIY